MTGITNKRAVNPLMTLILLTVTGMMLFTCKKTQQKPANGVTRELAAFRSSHIDSLKYDISLDIPETVDQPITGTTNLIFTATDSLDRIILDFDPARQKLRDVRLDEEEVSTKIQNGHIIITVNNPPLKSGSHNIKLTFEAGGAPLNRNEEYLYSLFVPGRASQTFPVFDQPDMKARFQLSLQIPADWKAISNSPADTIYQKNRQTHYQFKETPPLPTYLFSFAAGKFQVEEARRDGRKLRFFHRETDSAKIARNRKKIFDLHGRSLNWLEEYTGISYPFEKFDFVLIPAFQYGGMEHPGAILYRAGRILLDKSPTQQEKLGRAGLIAHETAHMWFGDLVTMKWFDDVWTKEVFANFMAAKIVHPSFPDINHEQRFILEHFPSAYSVDRTRGTHPIRQKLKNLNNAGSLYGALIYHKAPIVMQKLEKRLGSKTMREGLRIYLNRYQWKSASWPDLMAVFDSVSSQNMNKWNQIWVEEAGRPIIEIDRMQQKRTSRPSVRFRQHDPLKQGRIWPQILTVHIQGKKSSQSRTLNLGTQQKSILLEEDTQPITYILPNAGGSGYGFFKMDSASLNHFLDHLPQIQSAKHRSIIWINIWENLLDNRVPIDHFLRLAQQALPKEDNVMNTERILGYLEEAFWRYATDSLKKHYGPKLEQLLWNQMTLADSSSLKSTYFKSFRDLATTDEALDKLYQVWDKQRSIDGVTFSTRDYTRMAALLSVHDYRKPKSILDQQQKRIENTDWLQRFKFIRPALSPNPQKRDQFFNSLKNADNRRHEPWVTDAVRYLHHPTRKDQSRKYLYPSLKMLEEIKQTGDIFFPKNWLDASFTGHNTLEAALVVKSFLEVRESYPHFLLQKLLQSSDPLFRAINIRRGTDISIDEPRSSYF